MGSRPVPEPEFVALVCETRRDRGRRSRESFRSVRGGLGGLDGGNALLAVIVQLLLENDPEAGTEGRYQDHSTVERIAVVRPDILRAAARLRQSDAGREREVQRDVVHRGVLWEKVKGDNAAHLADRADSTVLRAHRLGVPKHGGLQFPRVDLSPQALRRRPCMTDPLDLWIVGSEAVGNHDNFAGLVTRDGFDVKTGIVKRAGRRPAARAGEDFRGLPFPRERGGALLLN